MRNLRTRFFHIITNPFSLALLIGLAFLPLVNTYFPEYTAHISQTGLVEKPGGLMVYYDIDQDKRSEQFISFINTQGRPAYKVTNQDGQITDQQEYEGDAFPVRCPLVFADLNKNQQPEVIAFYQRKDSLFFSIHEYGNDMRKQLLADTFVSEVKNSHGKPDFRVTVGPFADLDGDSVDEMIFSVMAGFPLIPRSHFIYNPGSRILLNSGFMGSTGNVSEVIHVTGNNKKALLLNEYAPGNMNDSIIAGENDEAVTFRVLDEHFKPWFPPVKREGEYGAIICKSLDHGGIPVIATIYQHKEKPMNPSWLTLNSLDGKVLSKRMIGDLQRQINWSFLPSAPGDALVSIMDAEGTIYRYDFHLNLLQKEKTFLSACSGKYMIDVDQDGKSEEVYFENDYQKVHICRNNLAKAVSIDTPHESYFEQLSLKQNQGHLNELFIQYNQKYYLVAYGKNPQFYFRFLAYLLVFLILAGFIYLMQLMQSYRLRLRYQNERNLAALQLKLVKKQVDPHFLFNVITTLSYNVLQKDPEEAYAGITKLARFMRSAVEWGDQIVRPLKAELEVVRTYLDLFSKQQAGRFEYSIEIREPVNLDLPVPVMIVQSFVENAIKHGIKAKEGSGRVVIRAAADQKNMYLEIEDNGVGRKVASQVSEKGTGKGINLMQQYMDLLNKVNDGKVGYTILDLQDPGGEPAGTLVKISISLNIKYIIE